MNLKRSLQNRLRGWFPQKTELSELRNVEDKVSEENLRQNCLSPVDVRKLGRFAHLSLMLGVVSGLFLFSTLTRWLPEYRSLTVLEFEGATTGLVTGALIGIASANEPLNQLLRSRRLGLSQGLVLLIGVLIVVVCYSLWLQESISRQVFLPLVNGAVGAVVAFSFTSGLLILKKMRSVTPSS
jgi:hypothetical protein